MAVSVGIGMPGWNVGLLEKFFGIAGRHKLLIILAVIFGLDGGNLAFMLTAPRYVSTAVVALDIRKVTVAPSDIVAGLPQETPALRTEIDIIGSRSMAERVIQRAGPGSLAPLLGHPVSGSQTDREALIDHLTGGLQASNDGHSFTIYISFTAGDPVLAALIANSYAEEYLAHQTMVKLNAVRMASEWLGKKVEELRRKLEASERAVDAIGIKNLNDARREAAANRSLYETFLTRYKAAIEQEDLASPEAQIISKAQPPGRPSAPKLLPLIVVGVVLGAALGVGSAFACEHFDDSVWSTAVLEQQSGLPVLGALPFLNSQRRWLADVAHRDVTEPPPIGSDAGVQRLQAVLMFSPATRHAQVIVVTSALQHEGKTFVSILLAQALAASGASAVVVGADLHRPALADRLGIKTSFSWAEVIAGKKTIDDIVQRDPASNIDVIAADSPAVDPAVLFTVATFGNFLTGLKQRYDYIIIDTPPLSASADSAMFGAVADATLLVVRWRTTTYGDVVSALRQTSLYGLPVAGIVLNQFDASATSYYGKMDYLATSLYRAIPSLDRRGEDASSSPDAPQVSRNLKSQTVTDVAGAT